MKKILFFTISLIVSLTSCKKKSSTTNQVTSNVTNEEIADPVPQNKGPEPTP